MSSKSWSCKVGTGHDKKTKSHHHQSNGKTTVVLPSPQSTALVTESPSGVPSKICVQVTLSLCACGAALGFCLLVAGGVERNHHGNIKVLMYIGILMFLVSVTLLVILCSSFGIFNIYPTVANNPEEPRCTCPTDSFQTAPPNQIVYSCPMEKPQKAIPHYCHLQESHLSTPAPMMAHYNVINLSKNELPRCTVKNCVCLLKNLGDENIKLSESKKEIMQIPFTFHNSINGCSFCYYGCPYFATPNTHYCSAGIDSCIHNPVSSHGLTATKAFSSAKQEFPLRDQRPLRHKGSCSRERNKEESSKL